MNQLNEKTIIEKEALYVLLKHLDKEFGNSAEIQRSGRAIFLPKTELGRMLGHAEVMKELSYYVVNYPEKHGLK